MNWQEHSTGLRVPAKRYRIGELIRNSPFSRQTIHNYTVMGLIREVEWTDGGHRLYDESVFEQLSRIVELRKTKSLKEIRRLLREEESAARARDFAGPASQAADV
ncbi:MAG TPA: MerR family transcriptional regulator [Sedimentisphaerales bacterium]|nr:MerR family transcriptional regulator [Sedimentisphaerales bacterium]HOV78411.1 MerR family transcriptional regulator [Sedimentisphaerales bacterium]HQI27076.1 MerR family transcriptional regulator [Sedimentisphaerales bacterium]